MATRRTNRRKPAEKKSLPIAAMFISFFVGAFLMFLLQIKDTASPDTPLDPVAKKIKKADSSTIEPTFDFYDILPETETRVERPQAVKKKQVATKAKTPVKTAAIEPPPSISYLVQAGSFKNPNDADGLKARMALLGIESKVQTVTIDNSETWHRILVGPIDGRDKADSIQEQLKKNKIDSFLLRTRRS